MPSIRIARYMIWLSMLAAIATNVVSTGIPPGYEYAALAILIVTGFAMMRLEARKAVAEQTLDDWADRLATAVKKQWAREAELRRLVEPPLLPVRWQLSTRRVAKRLKSVVGRQGWERFTPLPGLPPTTQESLTTGGGLTELHAVYGGLASGRLILTGNAAAGKTSTAVLLLREALRYRESVGVGPEQRRRIPVPVMLDLSDWNPNDEDPTQWIAGRLARQYTLFRGRSGRTRAEDLLRDGRIAVFLDGLDEVRKSLRPVILSALRSANFRIVLVSRSYETSTTLQKAPQGSAAVIEIRDVEPSDAVTYLLHDRPEPVPPAWAAVVANLDEEPSGTLATALSNPLFVSLVNEVYDNSSDGRGVAELLEKDRFPTPLAIQRHLLDQVTHSAYGRRPRQPPPRYSVQTAERTLRLLAERLDGQEDRSLEWWKLPSWVAIRRTALVAGIAAGLLQASAALFLLRYAMEPGWVAFNAIGTGLAAFLHSYAMITKSGEHGAVASAGWRDIFPSRAMPVGFAVWSMSGPLAVAVTQAGVLGDDPPPPWVLYSGALALTFGAILVVGRGYEMVSGTIIGMGSGSAFAPLREGIGPAEIESRSLGPRDVWRHHLGLRLVVGIMVGVAVGLMTGASAGWVDGVGAGLGMGACFALLATIVAGVARNVGVVTALAMVELAITKGTPLRLMAFLEDARRRNILRAVGPVYQFRHNLLLEHFAGAQKRNVKVGQSRGAHDRQIVGEVPHGRPNPHP